MFKPYRQRGLVGCFSSKSTGVTINYNITCNNRRIFLKGTECKVTVKDMEISFHEPELKNRVSDEDIESESLLKSDLGLRLYKMLFVRRDSSSVNLYSKPSSLDLRPLL